MTERAPIETEEESIVATKDIPAKESSWLWPARRGA